jgi:hypothetical protein
MEIGHPKDLCTKIKVVNMFLTYAWYSLSNTFCRFVQTSDCWPIWRNWRNLLKVLKLGLVQCHTNATPCAVRGHALSLVMLWLFKATQFKLRPPSGWNVLLTTQQIGGLLNTSIWGPEVTPFKTYFWPILFEVLYWCMLFHIFHSLFVTF